MTGDVLANPRDLLPHLLHVDELRCRAACAVDALLAILVEPADDTLPLGAGLAHLANVPVMCGDVR
jgi:hypothetical protein